MKNVSQSPKILLVAGLLGFTLVASAWQLHEKKSKNNPRYAVPEQRDTSITGQRYDDSAAFNLNGVDQQLAGLDTQLHAIDYQKIVSDALSRVDFQKIGKEVSDALKNVDWSKIQATVDQSLREAQKQVANINMDQLNEQMKNLQVKLNSREFRSNFDSAHLQEQIQLAMQSAKDAIAKARMEMQEPVSLPGALAKDGLLDLSKSYVIKLKNGILYINGKAQSPEISEKYQPFYQGSQYFILKGKPVAE